MRWNDRMLAQRRLAGWLAGWMDGYGYRMVMELGRKRDHSTAPFFSVFGLYIFVIPFVCSDFLCGLEGRKEGSRCPILDKREKSMAFFLVLSCLVLPVLSPNQVPRWAVVLLAFHETPASSLHGVAKAILHIRHVMLTRTTLLTEREGRKDKGMTKQNG